MFSNKLAFGSLHTTLGKVHRIADTIEETLKEKIFFPVFLDKAQNLYIVYFLISKIKNMLPRHYIELLVSNITNF